MRCCIRLPAGLINRLAATRTLPQDINAGGSTIDLLHRSLTDARILEAAQRGYGYSSTDLPAFASDLFELMAQLEYLHQGELLHTASSWLAACLSCKHRCT